MFIYYSGHGVTGLKDGYQYLLPVDGDPNAPEIQGYPTELLYRNLGQLEARSVTVFIDACFSGESPVGIWSDRHLVFMWLPRIYRLCRLPSYRRPTKIRLRAGTRRQDTAFSRSIFLMRFTVPPTTSVMGTPTTGSR